jgi:hypothetical protein
MVRKKKAGRPKVDAADKRSEPVKAMVTVAERAELQAAADGAARNLADWARLTLLEAARRKG